MTPPASGPMAVNSSRAIPSRRFATRRSRYTPAAAPLVTITQTRLTPTAVRSGSPKPSVRSGTIRIPPPSPRRDPNRPVAIPPTSRISPSITAKGDGASADPPPSGLWPEVLRRVREQSDDARPLQGHGQLALVLGAGAGLAARLDLRPLREVAAEAVDLLVVDRDRLVGAERADLAAAPVAVVVVSLLGSGRRHSGSPRRAAPRRADRSGSVQDLGQKGRSSSSASSKPREPPPAPAAAGVRAGAAAANSPSASSRDFRSRAITLSAVISSDVRCVPSLASYSRVRKRPSTKTRLPFRNSSAARSARSPQIVTRNQSVP